MKLSNILLGAAMIVAAPIINVENEVKAQDYKCGE